MKSKTVFICKQCGNETPRWQGQCPACGAWNSIVEFEDKKVPAAKAAGRAGIARAVPKKLKEVTGEQEIRFSTGMQELDRVLGGGGVRGSLILVGGAPGIGKSTLLLQICAYLGKTLRNRFQTLHIFFHLVQERRIYIFCPQVFHPSYQRRNRRS